MTEFGKYLRILRIKNNEILKDMANKLGISVSYLSSVELGERQIPENWLTILRDKYNLSKKEFVTMQKAYDDSLTEIKLNIGASKPFRKSAVLQFARKFDDLSQEQVEDILKVIRRDEH